MGVGIGSSSVSLYSPGLLFTRNEVSRNSGRLFGNIEYPLTDKLLFNGSAMLQVADNNDVSLSPKLGLNKS